jgi:predicted permease
MLLSDFRHAWRTIVSMPILSSVVVLSLGVGIGVNTAVFSWIQALILRPLPGVAQAGRFQLIEPRAESGSYPGVSWLEYLDLRDRLSSFRGVLAFRMTTLNLAERGRTERAHGLLVSGNYFAELGLRPFLGRLLEPEDVRQAGGESVAVVSHGFWQARLGGEAAALGRTIRLNDRELTVVGVVPPAFQGTVLGLQFDIWVPATLAPTLLAGSTELEDRRQRGYSLMGTLTSGASLARARQELDAAMRELARLYPEASAAIRGEVLPFWQAPRGPQRLLAQALLILQGLMLILLLAVCGNTANLVLARASSRQREIGVRLALGASRWRVIGLLFTENVVLAFFAAVLGVVLAMWGTEALRAVPLYTGFPIRFQTSIDLTGLMFAMALGFACAVLFGAAPAVQFARTDPQRALRSGISGAAPTRLRNALIGVEVMLALMVLLAAGMFFESFTDARTGDPGFRREGVLLASYDFEGRNIDALSARSFASRLLERLQAVPGVEAAAISRAVPLDIHGLPLRTFALEGQANADGSPQRALANTVTPGYFKTMGIALLSGQDFAGLRDPAAPQQVVVNEEFVRRYLGGAEPIGRGLVNAGRRHLIAGVVRNSMYESFGEAPLPIMYFSYRDWPAGFGQIHVRTTPGAEAGYAGILRGVVQELDPALPLYDVRTLTEHVETNLFFRRIPARIFVVLGPLILLLAAVGIYAVVAYAVSRRTNEIGVRLALGATSGRVVGQIIRENLVVVMRGALVGWLITYFLTIHLMPGAPINLPVFAGVPLLLIGVAVAACWLPARRASRVDPIAALRHES